MLAALEHPACLTGQSGDPAVIHVHSVFSQTIGGRMALELSQ
ncbi:hypothetical protein [Hoeflea sp.]